MTIPQLKIATKTFSKIWKSQKTIIVINNLILFFVSTLLSRVSLSGGFSPFGLAFISASTIKGNGFYSILGGFFGYFILSSNYTSIKYMASALLVITSAAVFREIASSKHPLFLPICSSVSIAITGIIFLVDSGINSQNIILYISEISITFALTFFYSNVFKKTKKDKTSFYIGLSLIICVLALSFGEFYVFGLISPVKVLICLAILSASYLYGANICISVAILLGIIIDANSSGFFFTGAFAIISLVSSYSIRFGRIIFCASFVLSASALSFLSGDLSIALIYESIIATSIFVFIPQDFIDKFRYSKNVKNNANYSKKLRETSKKNALELSHAFYKLGLLTKQPETQTQTGDNEMSMIFDKTQAKVCKSCYGFSGCWEKDYNSTFSILNEVSDIIWKRKRVLKEDFPGYFSAKCKNLDRFIDSINDSLNIISHRHALNEQLNQNRQLIAEQYDGIKGILNDFGVNIANGNEFLQNKEKSVLNFANTFGKTDEVYVYKTNTSRICTEITGDCIKNILKNRDKFLSGLSDIMATPLKEPELVCNPDGNRLIIRQKEPYNAFIGMALQKKAGEEVSGDSCNYFVREDGKAVIIITDGMGSGLDASIESSEALSVLEHFLKSGVSANDALKAIVPAIKMRCNSFVTLDVATLDLFTGFCEIVKWGSAPSYIITPKGVMKIHSKNFADKIYGTNSTDTTRVRLAHNDILIMMSDGVSDGLADEWLMECLNNSYNKNPKDIAGLILKAAKERYSDDDMSCIAIKIKKV